MQPKAKKHRKFGLKIVTMIREKANEYSHKYNYSFIVAGNYDEEVNKDFLEFDRAIFGKIKDVTDKEKYTSAFGILEKYDINKKIKTEAPYHEITNGGHMIKINKSYLDKIESEDKKVQELIKTIKDMYNNEIGFASFE